MSTIDKQIIEVSLDAIGTAAFKMRDELNAYPHTADAILRDEIRKQAREIVDSKIGVIAEVFQTLSQNEQRPPCYLGADGLDLLLTALTSDAPITVEQVDLNATLTYAEDVVWRALVQEIVDMTEREDRPPYQPYAISAPAWIKTFAMVLESTNPYLYNRRLVDIELSVRVHNALAYPRFIEKPYVDLEVVKEFRERIRKAWPLVDMPYGAQPVRNPTVQQIAECTPRELATLKNFGKKSIQELDDLLGEMGVCRKR